MKEAFVLYSSYSSVVLRAPTPVVKSATPSVLRRLVDLMSSYWQRSECMAQVNPNDRRLSI